MSMGSRSSFTPRKLSFSVAILAAVPQVRKRMVIEIIVGGKFLGSFI